MEDKSDWFPEKKGMPLFEKFAMIILALIAAKYVAKAIKNAPKMKVKHSWKDFYAACFMTALIFFFSGVWDVRSFLDDFIAVFALIFYSFLFKKFFMKD